MNETSFLELVGQLCDIHLEPTARAFRVQPAVSRSTKRKQLRLKAYDTLFAFLKNTAIRDEGAEAENRRTAEGILLESYKLRTHRRFEDADRLESLYDQLRKDNSDDMCQYLRLIASLRGSGGTPQQDKLMNGVFNIPQPKEVARAPGLLPAGPLCYGDVRLLEERSQQFYMHYPKELFERPLMDISTGGEKAVCKTFDLLPGTGLGADCLFTSKFLLGDVHEQTTRDSLFGGLVQGRVTELSAQLELPDLSSDFRIRVPEFRCHRSMSSSLVSEESGLGSEPASMSSSVTTISETSGYDDSFWELALTEARSNHYAWEWIGYLPGPTEKPYLTEAGPRVFDILVKLRRRVSVILCPESKDGQVVTVQSSVLGKHILLMLIGVPSSSFPFSQETQSFSIIDGLHISGMSPDMLSSFLSEFVECGSLFARLSDFSRPPVLNSFYTAGLTFQAFTKAIRKFLSHFVAAILRIPEDLQLLKLSFYLLKATEQIRYVAQLCHCHDTGPALQGFPTGMKLLSYLYDEANASSSSSHYPLILSILQTTFAPFVLFIRDWVFHGVHRDFYNEFMIKVDLGCMEYRDETYWSRAYTLMSERLDEEGTPQFLRDCVHDVVTCGKSLNLLRICNRQHFLCNVSESDLPTLSITFSYQDLKATERNCQTYIGRMRQIAQQNTQDREELLRKTELERLELQQMARRVADQELARLQGVINEKRKKAKSKKQTEFVRLKEQMNADLKRRADDREQAKEEDRNLLAQHSRKEHALEDEEMELEKKVREELVAYYTELGKEAMHRERLALWKIRRSQLENSRLLFLEADAERWRQELAQHLQTQDSVDAASQSLPAWVDKSLDQGTTVLVSGDGEITLPTWALQESSHGSHLSDDDGVVLPRWAQAGTQATDVSVDEKPSVLPRRDQGGIQASESRKDWDKFSLPRWAQVRPSDTQSTESRDNEKPLDDVVGVETTEIGTGHKLDTAGESSSSQCQNELLHVANVTLPVPPTALTAEVGRTNNTLESLNVERSHGTDESEEHTRHRVTDESEEHTRRHFTDESEEHTRLHVIDESEEHTRLSVTDESEEHTRPNITDESEENTKPSVTDESEKRTRPHVTDESKEHTRHHATDESEEHTRPRATDESEERTTKSSVRFVQGMGVATETEQVQEVRHTRMVASMSATKESDPCAEADKPHLKSVKGMQVSAQSTDERQMIPRRNKDLHARFSSQETEAPVWIIKKPSMFGHVSQLSNTDYILNIPTLKRQIHQHANLESDFKDFSIRPSIRMRKNMSASTESSVPAVPQLAHTHIRVFAHRNASTESQREDENSRAVRRFRAHNERGHSSDSTIQRLLYGDLQLAVQDSTDGPYERIDIQPGLPYQSEPYQTGFDELAQDPCIDLMSNISVVDLGRDLVDAVVTSQEEIEAYKYTPLSVLLGRSIMAPVRAQVVLVNSALVNYFTSELKVDGHFEAIRRYLLMADGDFAEILSNILLEKMFKNPKPHEILNPMFLNGALNKAVRSSIHSNDENSQNLSFALKYMPSVFLPNAPKSLNCLELRYTVTWPLNIILSSACMAKYYQVFTFLLQIKRVVWTLKDVWHRLKRDALISKAGNTTQFRHLQLHRQEMEHFVKMMQGYITSQVILVSWQEFQMALAQPIDGLDQLRSLHEHYVDKVISRCLLDKKAEKVMKIIQDIFCLILKFRSQLVSSSWQGREAEPSVSHPNFGNLETTYKSFHVYSFFLFKVVNRLSQKGYQPHLQELLLQLNFNGYYTEAAN